MRRPERRHAQEGDRHDRRAVAAPQRIPAAARAGPEEEGGSRREAVRGGPQVPRRGQEGLRRRSTTLAAKHPEYKSLVDKLAALYAEITRKGLENEQKPGKIMSKDKKDDDSCKRQGLRQRAQEAARRAGQAAAVGGAQGTEGLHRLRGPRRRRQGRHDQGDHRARQPARVPRRRAAGADRAREDPDVRPALHAAPAGGRRDRDLRPQLVQPRRRRARDGLLHRGARSKRFLQRRAARREGDRRIRASSSSSTGSR